MRIAVPYENGQVFQHFGHTGQVKIYDVKDGQIVKEQVADTTGSGHGALAGFLSGLKVDVLICGGVTGEADGAVRAFLAGTLTCNGDIHCGHHEHHGHCGEDKRGCAGKGGKCGG